MIILSNNDIKHQSQPSLFAVIGPFCLFLIFNLIFPWLFGGLSKLHFLRILYSQKGMDVQFPLVMSSFHLELRSLRYRAQKEGDAKAKIFWMFFLEKIISSNPKQISSSSFGENQLRPSSSRWSSSLVPVLDQSVQFIV